MAHTLFARIKDMSQYDPAQREVRWVDENPTRWTRVYSQLLVRDKAVFVGKGMVYIGTVTAIDRGHRTVVCSDVASYISRVDDLLRVAVLQPELMSRMKGMFVPFVIGRPLDVDALGKAILDEDLVSFHVFASADAYKAERDKVKINDRVLIMESGQFGPVRLQMPERLIDFEGGKHLRVKGLTPTQVQHLLAASKEEGGLKSSAVALARRMGEKLERDGSFTFRSFNGYHNTLYNKRAFGKPVTPHGDIPEDDIEDDEVTEAVDAHPLNQILFGPPGTGKTHRTIDKALEIFGVSTANRERAELKALFDGFVAEGRIVFCTFHQSLTYEDFIEGIKPLASDDSGGAMSYRVEPGIFRRLCHDASLGVAAHAKRVASLQAARALGNSEQRHLVNSLTLEEYRVADAPPFVIIIDEINRANVSQVLGELITLLEEDKRLGRAERLTVTLPYSKEHFGVPPNVYLIGTMNTADRSVEALDTALRRRFVFEPVLPDSEILDELQPEPVCGFRPSMLMETINARLELLLGRDHLIGHAYFIGVTDAPSLKACFCNKIIPLLSEYFYGDPGRIGLVLGSGFVRLKHDPDRPKVRFASFDYDAGELEQGRLYEIVPEQEIDIDKAVKELMRGVDTHAGPV